MANPATRSKAKPKNPEAIRLWKLARLASYLHSEYQSTHDPYAEMLATSALDLRNHSIEAAKRASISTQQTS